MAGRLLRISGPVRLWFCAVPETVKVTGVQEGVAPTAPASSAVAKKNEEAEGPMMMATTTPRIGCSNP